MLARHLKFWWGFRACTCKIGVLLGVFGRVWGVHVWTIFSANLGKLLLFGKILDFSIQWAQDFWNWLRKNPLYQHDGTALSTNQISRLAYHHKYSSVPFHHYNSQPVLEAIARSSTRPHVIWGEIVISQYERFTSTNRDKRQLKLWQNVMQELYIRNK